MKFDPNSEYIKYHDRWVMAKDFSVGGQAVLKPDHTVSDADGIGFNDYSSTASGDAIREPSWDIVDGSGIQNSYLHKNPNESDDEFRARKKRAFHIPIYAPTKDIIVNGVLRKAPDRDSVENMEFFGDFIKDCDMAGTNLGSFMRSRLDNAIDYGRSHIFVCMSTPANGKKITSLAEQLEYMRPYLRVYNPIDVLDWEVDSKGNLVWAKVIEPNSAMRGPEDPERSGKEAIQYRLIHQGGWKLYRHPTKEEKKLHKVKGSELILVKESKYDLGGAVPWITIHTRPDGEWACESPLSSTIDLDRTIFNRLSELNHLERHAGFPILLLPMKTGEDGGGQLTIGPTKAIAVDPQARSMAEYISPDSKHAEGYWTRTKEIVELNRNSTLALGDLGNVRQEVRSGEMVEQLKESRRNIFRFWGEQVQEAENRIYYFIGKLLETDYPRVEYPLSISTTSIYNQINSLLTIKDLPVDEEKIKQASNRVADKVIEELR